MTVNRRAFLTIAALGSVATFATASCGSSTQGVWPALEFVPELSGELTRLALIADASALALQTQTLPDIMRRALLGTPGLTSILGMGVLFPSGASVISFLGEARRGWLSRGNPNDEHRVAVATGYLMHRAVEQRLGAGLVAAGIKAAEVDAAKLQQDAEVIRSFMSEVPPTEAEAKALLSVLDQRLRIQIHTLKPDGTDEKTWVRKLLEWDAAQEDLFERLAAAIAEPDTEDYARYVEAPKFFDRNSRLVQAVRGQNATQSSIEQASSDSLYDLGLTDCARVVALVCEFLDGSISGKDLVQALDQT
ncbi:MAG: hypothetical protein AAF651_09385 [Cyanobacteria bacterium P01_C01_bin.73]